MVHHPELMSHITNRTQEAHGYPTPSPISLAPTAPALRERQSKLGCIVLAWGLRQIGKLLRTATELARESVEQEEDLLAVVDGIQVSSVMVHLMTTD